MILDKIIGISFIILLAALFLIQFAMGLAIAHVKPFCRCCDDVYCEECPEGIHSDLPE